MKLKYNAVDFGLHENLIESIISLAKKYDLNKLYIFGSRARGDFKERSDIDLAAIGGNIPLFSIDVEEETPTLLFFDVVDLNQGISVELQKEIDKDGILIYEKV